MQNFLSLFIVFILSVSPIVNASVSVSSCDHMMNEPLLNQHSMNSVAMADMDINQIKSSSHDCCDTLQIDCDNTNACDCDNSQVNYSSIASFHMIASQYLDSFKPSYLSPPFNSKSSDSLYRPPISIIL